MLTLIVGKPGAGKSLTMVESYIIKEARGVKEIRTRSGIGDREGVPPRHVITNLPVLVERVERDFPETRGFIHVVDGPLKGNLRPFTDPKNLEEWSQDFIAQDGRGPLLVIDEAHMSFPRGKVNQELLEYLTMHRHSGVDIVLATQQVTQMDRNVCGLAEIYIVLKRSRSIGLGKNSYRRWEFDGYPKGAEIAFTRGTHNRKCFKYYRSHYNPLVQESSAGGKPLWLRWQMILMYVLVIAAIAGAATFGYQSVEKIFVKKPTKVIETLPTNVPADVPVAPPPTTLPNPLTSPSTIPGATLPGDAEVAAPGVLGEQFSSGFENTTENFKTSMGNLGLGFGLDQTQISKPWEINAFMGYMDMEGEWRCKATWKMHGQIVRPYELREAMSWEKIEYEYEEAIDNCIVTITDLAGHTLVIASRE